MGKNRILITGSAGFIGSHLTELCVEKGYDVKTFVYYNSRNYWGWLEESKYKGEIEIVAGQSTPTAPGSLHALFWAACRGNRRVEPCAG
jgi:nucleoside-diphosphate-sugar epimerase